MAPDEESRRRETMRNGKNALEKPGLPFNGQLLVGDEEFESKHHQIMNGSCDDIKDSQMDDGLPSPSVLLCSPGTVRLEWQKVHKIGAGLANLGNTCFLNTVIQCLTYTPPLANFLLQDDHITNCKNVEFCMMCELQKHMKQVLDHSGEVIKPLCIYQNLKFIAEHFQFGRQEDAHEFLRFVVENLWRSSLYNYDCNGRLDPASRETTIINHIFGGYNRSQVTCLQCRKKSNKYEHFMDFILDIKHSVHTLEKALEKFIQPELLENDNAYKCPSCNMHVPAAKRFTVHRSPNVATFQLKRFDYNRSFGGKITKHVTYPEKLDLRPFMSERKGAPLMYRLNAVLVHMGQSCNSGHYYCYIRNSNGSWYLMDDARVQRSSLHDVLNQQAYVLFYVKMEKLNGMNCKRNGMSSSSRSHLGIKNKCIGHSTARGIHSGPAIYSLQGAACPEDNCLTTMVSSFSSSHLSQSISLCHNPSVIESNSQCLLNGQMDCSTSSSGSLWNGHYSNGLLNGPSNSAFSLLSPGDNICSWNQKNAQRIEKASYTLLLLNKTDDPHCSLPDELNGKINNVPYLENSADFANTLLGSDESGMCHDSISLNSKCCQVKSLLPLHVCHNHSLNTVSNNSKVSQSYYLKHVSSCNKKMQDFSCCESLADNMDISESVKTRVNHLVINSCNTDSELVIGNNNISNREFLRDITRSNNIYDLDTRHRKRHYTSAHISSKVYRNIPYYKNYNFQHSDENCYDHKLPFKGNRVRYLEKNRCQKDIPYLSSDSINLHGQRHHTNEFDYIPRCKKIRMHNNWQNGYEYKINYRRKGRNNKSLALQKYRGYTRPEYKRHISYPLNHDKYNRIQNKFSSGADDHQTKHFFKVHQYKSCNKNTNHCKQKPGYSVFKSSAVNYNSYQPCYNVAEKSGRWKVNHFRKNWKSKDMKYKYYNSYFSNNIHGSRIQQSPHSFTRCDFGIVCYRSQQKWCKSNRSSY